MMSVYDYDREGYFPIRPPRPVPVVNIRDRGRWQDILQATGSVEQREPGETLPPAVDPLDSPDASGVNAGGAGSENIATCRTCGESVDDCDRYLFVCGESLMNRHVYHEKCFERASACLRLPRVSKESA